MQKSTFLMAAFASRVDCIRLCHFFVISNDFDNLLVRSLGGRKVKEIKHFSTWKYRPLNEWIIKLNYTTNGQVLPPYTHTQDSLLFLIFFFVLLFTFSFLSFYFSLSQIFSYLYLSSSLEIDKEYKSQQNLSQPYHTIGKK